MGLFKRKTGETSSTANGRRLPKIRSGTTAMLLVAAGVGGAGVYKFEDWRNGNVAANTKEDCESSISAKNVNVTDEIVVSREQVEPLVNAALNPYVAEHADGDELQASGYTAIQEAASEHGYVQITVPFDMDQPFSDKKELKRLTADADLLSKLIRSRLAGDQDSIVSVVPVPGEQAYPVAPMTVVIGDQFC